MLRVARLAVGVSFWWLVAVNAAAAPGDTLFSDPFDSGAGCRGLAPLWTTSSSNLSGTSTQTSNSGACALFTRGSAVTTESVAIDLTGVAGAELQMWIRVGSDAFSEDPDGGEDVVIEYVDTFGSWRTLDTRFGSSPNGQISNLNYELPAAALHSAFRIRFRQTGGSGGPPANGGIGWDYWHVDDVMIIETATPPPPPPTSTLGAGQCDNFEGGFGNWQTTSTTAAGIGTQTANSGVSSMFLRHTSVTAEAVPFDAAGVSRLDVWIRRGADAFSENPDGSENLSVQYRNDSGVWVTLETFIGGGTPGQVFNRQYALPVEARHAAFSVRFVLAFASGVDFDYWHVDDVCLVAGNPDLQVSKSIVTEQDPVNGFTGPFAIPGAWLVYTLDVTNQGIGSPDNDTLVIVDDLPGNTALFTGDFDGSGAPFDFTDGTPSSGLSLPFTNLSSVTDGVTFFDADGNAVVPNGDFDPAVRRFEIAFPGTMRGTGSGGASQFSLRYRVRLD